MRIKRALHNDPPFGIFQHLDTSYCEATPSTQGDNLATTMPDGDNNEMTDRLPHEPLIAPRIPPTHRDPVQLSQEPVEYEFQGTKHQEHATISLILYPRFRIHIIWRPKSTDLFHSHHLITGQGRGIDLHFPERGISIKALVVHSGTVITCIPASGLVEATQPCNDLKYVIAHIFNCPEFFGSQPYTIERHVGDLTQSVRCDLVQLTAQGWSTTLSSVENTSGALEDQRRSGGLVLTHMLRIESDEHRLFNSRDARDVLAAIYLFLSFAVGQRIGLGAISGHDRNNGLVWELWGMHRASLRTPSFGHSWLDPFHAHWFEQAWPGFYTIWKDPEWEETLRKSIDWYLQANLQGSEITVQTQLILAQAALEHLAWMYCVKQKRMVSEAAFSPRGLSAEDKLRLLAVAMEIPIEVPPSLPSLRGRRGKPWRDLAQIITELRNSVVHPSKDNTFDQQIHLDAWKASMWLLELVLLRLFNYDGSYRNRLVTHFAGETDEVPWVARRD